MININNNKTHINNLIIMILSIMVSLLIYVSTIVNMSGFGDSINSNYRTFQFCLMMILFFYICNFKYGIQKSFLRIVLMGFVFICTSIISDDLFYAIKVLSIIASIYTFSFIGKIPFSIKFISYLYPLITIYILYDFNNDGLTGGWNPNVIGMIGFVGAICAGYNLFEKSKLIKILNVIIVFNIITLLEITDNRSAYIGIVIAVFLNFIINKIKYKEKKLKIISVFIYCIPIIIVILIIGIYRSPIAEQLNEISIEYTEKPLFSGREIVWNYMINKMKGFWLLGHGTAVIGNAHNIFINFLFSYGIIGYLLYSLFFIGAINDTYKYVDDYIVRYSIVAHFAIYIQQSFECILMDGVKVILISYVFLMIAIGRCKYLKGRFKNMEAYNEK